MNQSMYQKFTLLVFLCATACFYGQEKYEYDFYTNTNIETGYSYNFGKLNNKNFHLLSIGLNKTTYGGRHGGGYSYGMGTDIALNTKNFTIAPKVNGFIYYQFIVIGSELAWYTDFKKSSLRYIPIFGIGNAKAKITINPHVILTTKEFDSMNRGAIQLTINFSLDKKKRN